MHNELAVPSNMLYWVAMYKVQEIDLKLIGLPRCSHACNPLMDTNSHSVGSEIY